MLDLIAIILLLAVSFILSGLEAALLAITRARLRREAEENSNPRARRLENLMKRRTEVLASILVLNNACNITAFVLITIQMVEWTGTAGYLWSLLICAPLYVVWVELLPKSIFQQFPFRMLASFLFLLKLMHLLFLPIFLPMRSILKRTRLPSTLLLGDSLNQGRDSLREVTASIERAGTLNPDEGALIQHVLEFASVRADQLMLPLRRVTAIPLEMPLSSVLQIARDTDYDQFPVLSSNGDLVGQVRVIEVLRAEIEGKRVSDFIRRMLRTSPDEPAISVLERLRQARTELAAVYSATGRPLGIISSHDIVKELMRAT